MAICTVIVAGLFLAALQASTVAGMNVRWQQDATVGTALGQDLLSEIMQQPYADPTSGTGSFGLEAGEAGASRALYDDVDDYNGWDRSPPAYRDGTNFTWATGYRRAVSVAWVHPTSLATQGSETLVKRIVVTVSRQERAVATLTALRSKAAGHPPGATPPPAPTVLEELLKLLP